jgi:hypothetical protein
MELIVSLEKCISRYSTIKLENISWEKGLFEKHGRV